MEVMTITSYKALPECSAVLSSSTRDVTHLGFTRYGSSSRSTVRLVMIFVALCVLPLIVTAVDARVFVVRSKNSSNRPCKVHKNQALHAIMDRVCVICHEMFSHERPNMRAECRSNCFKSEHFRKCLDMFRPSEQAKVLFEDSRR
ncbi:Uncharacterized protein Tcan_07094 [Toxocara canis]|uniref:Uncharacterized protein n=1 Tax=Toxocara canis TaxID=6265 RepID=A0A0B2VTG7_TOXCA|nr:Uncharacterized protein Tcan_07094 [Toxocara canis]